MSRIQHPLRERAETMLSRGVSPADAALVLGLDRHTIENWRRAMRRAAKLGSDPAAAERKQQQDLAAAARRRIRALRAKGAPTSAIARETGLSRQRVAAVVTRDEAAMTPLDRARAAAMALVSAPAAERSAREQDLARAIRVDEDVPPGRACLWLMPDGTTTTTLRGTIRAWRAAVLGREPGRPGRPRIHDGRRTVSVILDTETSALWDAYQGDRSSWIRYLIRLDNERQYPPLREVDHAADEAIDAIRDRDAGYGGGS